MSAQTVYDKKAVKLEETFFDSPEISEHNKEQVRRFLNAWSVSNARKAIFFRQIKQFLIDWETVTDLLDSSEKYSTQERRDIVNAYFNKIKADKSPAYYDTIVSIVNKFMKWLNDDVKPSAFRDVKCGDKKKHRRQLSASDMTDAEDVYVLLKHCENPMERAVVAVQLDCGLRPSELLSLRVKDVHFEGKVGYLDIVGGKTGERACVFHRCLVPLKDYLEVHPTKKPEDYLFGQYQRGKYVSYTNEGLAKMVKRVYRRVGNKKPCDLYALRHSSCYQDKLENMSPQVSAERHGHSIEYWEKIYGRLDPADKVKQMKTHVNSNPELKTVNIICPTCSTINMQLSDYCVKCNNPIKLEVAMKKISKMEQLEKNNAELMAFKKRFEEMIGPIEKVLNQQKN